MQYKNQIKCCNFTVHSRIHSMPLRTLDMHELCLFLFSCFPEMLSCVSWHKCNTTRVGMPGVVTSALAQIFQSNRMSERSLISCTTATDSVFSRNCPSSPRRRIGALQHASSKVWKGGKKRKRKMKNKPKTTHHIMTTSRPLQIPYLRQAYWWALRSRLNVRHQ